MTTYFLFPETRNSKLSPYFLNRYSSNPECSCLIHQAIALISARTVPQKIKTPIHRQATHKLLPVSFQLSVKIKYCHARQPVTGLIEN